MASKSTQKNCSILQKILNSALRILTNGDKYTSIESMLRKAAWSNIPNLIKAQRCSMMLKIIGARVSHRVHNLFTRVHTVTRASPMQLMWHHKTGYGEKSFVVNAWQVFTQLGMNNLSYKEQKSFLKKIQPILWNRYGNGNI